MAESILSVRIRLFCEGSTEKFHEEAEIITIPLVDPHPSSSPR